MREIFSNLKLHAYIRRVDADTSWLSWTPVDSCALRLEYYDYNRIDFVEYEKYFRLKVEEIVLRYKGSGHRGKLWYRHASDLFKFTSKAAVFEDYRRTLDPRDKFENLYTLEASNRGQRFFEPLPYELQVRAFVWRVFVWFAVGVSAFVLIFMCSLMGRRIHILPIAARPVTLTALSAPKKSRMKGISTEKEMNRTKMTTDIHMKRDRSVPLQRRGDVKVLMRSKSVIRQREYMMSFNRR